MPAAGGAWLTPMALWGRDIAGVLLLSGHAEHGAQIQ